MIIGVDAEVDKLRLLLIIHGSELKLVYERQSVKYNCLAMDLFNYVFSFFHKWLADIRIKDHLHASYKTFEQCVRDNVARPLNWYDVHFFVLI